ncbi:MULTISPECIES: Rv2175c family DNA-binding protein [Subtercola]|uniref:DNA-binding protein n=1 Tax=Subtercola vilae TaxID=2056433 RepID=A0A4T2BVA7_9MICO|nr:MULTISPECIES: Rv2175c family DNA-binding protein [Subtercola]MEA9983919.1 Rv2175c family DNA-binding protein [Subtercola sp. RTI3]TIH34461.1 DNA-binding protein [Subtercola vilae]
MSETSSARNWLSITDLSDRLGITPSKVRKLIEEGALLAVRRDGVLSVPDVFIAGDLPLSELKGTIVVLGDSGFSNDEMMTWMLEPEDSLGAAPIDALLAGRKAEVRRIAQALG